MRWLDLGWVLPVVIGLGCGNSVTTDPTGSGGSGAATSNGGSGGSGATGGGGSGGATVTTTTTPSTTSSSSTSSTTSSSTTTFVDTCEEACAKAGGCGLPADTCAQYLSCGTAQGECAAACLNDPNIDCADIFEALQSQSGPLIDCVFGCQGGQGGAGGGGQGGAGGGSPAACQDCGQNACQNAFIQCAQSAGFQACQDWLACAQGCSDAACLDACTAMTPGAQVVEDCLCTSCANDCGAVCNGGGGQGGAGGGMPACQNCETLAFQGGNNPCAGSATLLSDVKDCICVGCANQCANECANPNINLGNAGLACQQCAGGQIQGACAMDWQACQNDPN